MSLVGTTPTLAARRGAGASAVGKRRVLRSVFGLAAAAVAAWPLAGRLSQGFSAPTAGPHWALPAAPAEQLHSVVLLVGSCGPADHTRGSAVAMAAVAKRPGNDKAIPGGAPAADAGGVPEPPRQRKQRLRPGEETEDMMMDRVERKILELNRLKGKFVPKGPKPWDQHRFLKVCIQSRLKPKQASNTKIINQVVEELRRVSGMHPKIVKAKHNVATFGWRVGYPCGVAVSITGPLMYDFLGRLNTIILPRVRDFEGLVPSSFDNYGNFWMGVQNQECFKELDSMIDDRQLVHGFDIGILNSCFTQPDGLKLMKDFGFPFGDPRPKKLKKKVAFSALRGIDKSALKKPAAKPAPKKKR